jgi:urate oxidase
MESLIMSPSNENSNDRTINYGKEKVAVYRTYANSLEGVRSIPESSFDGRENILFGADVRAQVEGEEFLPSFRDGDNNKVVATDSMKNFILHHAGDFGGNTLEAFLHHVGQLFLETYSQMDAVRLSAEEFPFDKRPVPTEEGYESSSLVFRVSDNESSYGELYLTRSDGRISISDQKSGVTDLELVKVKGSSFADYVQDEYTTLPEREDRTLFISLEIYWEYDDPEKSLGDTPEDYVPAEQVRDIAHTIFHEIHSNSIQDLIYQIGLRVLERFPQIEEVSFEANNRTWIEVRDDIEDNEKGKVLTEPPRPYGFQQFSMDRNDLEER